MRLKLTAPLGVSDCSTRVFQSFDQFPACTVLVSVFALLYTQVCNIAPIILANFLVVVSTTYYSIQLLK